MKKIMSIVFILVSILSVSCFADETDPVEILKKMRDTYKSMETYKSEGIRTIDTERDNQKSEMVTSYSILLKKPNLYRISYETTFTLGSNDVAGTIWSDGVQPYEYQSGTKSYSELSTDLNAIGRAAAMSSPTIIFTFFSSMLEEPWEFFERFENVKLGGIEKIKDEECYVISADLKVSPEEIYWRTSKEIDRVTRKEIFWISKARSVIVKHTASVEDSEVEYVIPDDQIIRMLKEMEQPVNEETMKELKTKMQMGPSNIKWVLTGTQTQIASPELTAADFRFALPEGTLLEKEKD